MARVRPSLRECARRLRTRVANCSVRIAFALYAAAALVVAIALSFVSTGLLGLAAEATLPADPYAYAGTYVYNATSNELVPAEALSWYETAAYDATIDRDVPGEEAVVLYMASETGGGRLPIPLDDPPAGARTNEVRDIAYLMGDAEEPTIPLADLPAYDAAATAAHSGAEATATLAAELPANAAGEKPVISNVGYYLPYPGDPQPYRALVHIAENLVSNAVRYAHSEVHLSFSWTDGTLELAVADDGPGFAETALARAAEPFWGESKGTNGHMGLGLYVARTLAERHGGKLELSTRPSGGALVRARVPAPDCSKPL